MSKHIHLSLPQQKAPNTQIDVLKIKTERNHLGLLKTLLVVFLIFLQFAVLISSYLFFFAFFNWLITFSFIASLITCIYVLSTNKNSQSKPIWILFLVLCFSFGYIIYFISDERVFWHKHKKRYNKILLESNDLSTANINSPTSKSFENNCDYLKSVGNFNAYTNTHTEYFASGTTFFDEVLKELQNATKFVFMEFFIVSDGVLLKRFLSILEEKVKQGVDVRLIYDDLGSHGTFSRKTKKLIKKSGIKLVSFNKLLQKFSMLLNYRDHRKIVVIDGKIAFTGGANLADEYINEKRLHGYWKDAGVKMVGPATDGFTLMFLRQWAFATKTEVKFESFINLAEPQQNNSVLVPYADGLEYDANIGKNAYTNMIANANEKIYIMSPYFVIDDTIKTLLINKARSGVDVRIILPEIADKKIVYIITRNNAEKLFEHGIKIYTMKNSFVHSKIMLTESSAIVSSINMDLRSFYQQFESAVLLNDSKVINEINLDFEKTFSYSNLLTKETLKRNKFTFRLIAGITNIISPFM